MELKNIRTFIKVAELENFTRAAEALGYAQSTVTAQVQQLEEELRANLFERNGKHIRLSVAGREFLAYAYQISKCEAMAVNHFLQDDQPEGTLKIGIMETLCCSRYTEFLYHFSRKYPKVSLKLEVATTLEAMAELDRGSFDVIFLLDKPVVRPDWQTARRFPAGISFFCAASHPLAGQKSVPVDRLLEERFILTEKGCNYRQVFEHDLLTRGRQLECSTEIGHTGYIINGVIRQLGIGLLPLFTLQEALARGDIALIQAEDCQIRLEIQVIYNTQRQISLPLQAFLRELDRFSPEVCQP